ncbi:MAG: hypothetical protein Q4B72_06050 [Lachnospiraceae bacterium]|nr:hypothetical protein [Lachnospiraceae bacterium]
MRSETHLSKAIDTVADADVRYDSNVKWLLSDKQILARILKYTLQEFMNESVEQIISCISEVEVENTYVEPGLTNLGKLKGEQVEDIVPNEGKIVFDIRFTVKYRKETTKILINVEAQKSSKPSRLGYHLENRVIYYLSRMVSAQKETEFIHSDYDNLKRVRSIWICMDADADGDAIEEISMYRKRIDCEDDMLTSMGLMKGIIVKIRRSADVQRSKNELIAMLEDLFAKTDAAEKKEKLKSYGLVMTEEIERRLLTVCNLSEIVREEGIEQGILSSIRKMLRKGYPESEIKEVLEVTDAQLAAAKK